ncbi:uncharacterized protein FIBRA_01372 [Fibroporia radiculosa]|uniref:Cleavage stimulation factor subunit 2 hinge domain-containing protein n=1 Tax=Fibroporia radiculosa TaxID=599839 RepID=J4H130_9APHY|nr:uncharacterized protein FIBRA_01372 [Fibroporia radiculosa]CCL99354.1 predicted protein [Fibroporia radiculosa]
MSKVVFVGNVPYNMGEELGGRPLRIDLADSDPFLEGKTTVRGELVDGGETRAQWRERERERERHGDRDDYRGPSKNHDPNAFLQSLPPGVPMPPGSTALDTISQMLATTNPTQILEVLAQMKAFVITHPEQARALLVAHPQLGYALFQALLLNNIVDAGILQRMLQATSASVPLQQPPPQKPPPAVSYTQPPPMQHPQPGFPPSMAVPHAPVHHPTPPVPAPPSMYPSAQHMPPPMQQPPPYYRPAPPPQPQPQPVPQMAPQPSGPGYDLAHRASFSQSQQLPSNMIRSIGYVDSSFTAH